MYARAPAAQKPASLEPEEYDFTHPNRGRCIIINNRNFNRTLTGQLDRDGTDIDAEACESTFLRLGFSVTRHDNLNQIDMSIIMREGETHPGNSAISYAQ